ncbi:hypothetical protein [Thalassococcus lentus]|uniref:Uncharacterized protein n=1 Tax=Thalassococcus lentus TaxID=1210524 RepID=A0ABT4XUH6_9RHOB|nr:hypothetical protein [Thalassococcus lentus]MDA7425583.1 hypothetical protein [Thalassococcus lentus]
MAQELLARLDALREQINAASESERAELFEHLDEIVLTLESSGTTVPVWARQRLADRIDESVEAQFDNMPF